MYQGKTKSGVDIKSLNGVESTGKVRTWIMVADSSRIRFFEREVKEKRVSLLPITEIVSERQKLEESDRPGRAFSSHTQAHHGQTGAPRHALEGRETPAEHEVNDLVRRGSEFLDCSLKKGKFESLDVFAGPHLLGIIRAELKKAVEKKLNRVEEKDLSWISGADLEKRILE